MNHGQADPWRPYHGVWCRTQWFGQDAEIVHDVLLGDCYLLRQIQPFLSQCELIVDVGAHLGSFAVLVRRFAPNAKIVCIEACPDNIEGLRRTVGDWAEVIHAACTYREGELVLLNALHGSTPQSTGGSAVVPAESEQARLHRTGQGLYKTEPPPPRITLEEIERKWGAIDLLKLDCEGSEHSILRHSLAAQRVKVITGEWHGHHRTWRALVQERFANWTLREWRTAINLGLFRLRNPIIAPRP